jgi:O-antigen biosynthesis protein
MRILDEEIQPLFWTPSRLDKDSAWWGHVPFAHWMVSACRPRILVELGTEKGVSYAAFCDAIQKSYIFKAELFAVDTWLGDEHTGHYGDEIYQELLAYNNMHYAEFSKLLRMTFDKARDLFFDHTIDILHIDGYHTYDAVSHDFNSWRPKLSDRAVVLFHDTCVRNKDYGVWQFFEELTRQFPTFNFLHSYGLGVVAIGSNVPKPIKELYSLSDSNIEEVRNIFAHLGAIWIGVNRSYRSLELLHADNNTQPH